MRRLYAELDALQFKPDYMCLIIDKEKDYHRACRGFSINGVEYVRLLGTNGGIKNETIVFVSKRLVDELRRRIDNGRDLTKELVPAKLEAYKSLTCSASIPVSMPKGILVVPDCETKFLDDVVYLDDERDGEPVMEFRPNTEICLNVSDGCGMMLPSLAERWSGELGLDYVMSCCNTRFSFEKGCVFTFDFIDFARTVAGRYIVKDAWGHDVDIRNVEIVLTTSMLKLWDSYDSIDSYLYNCASNKYTFGVTKVSPSELESERTSNYQYIQSFDLTDEDIDELIRPTVEEIREILSGDPVKSVLYLRGCGLNKKSIMSMANDWTKALLIDPASFSQDQYVLSNIYSMIRRRIDRAKVGVLNLHANYSIATGDPYALCQSMFGLVVTGLLKSGEIYNKYWCDCGSDEVLCFRAPMTTHENIRRVKIGRGDAMSYWYRYIKTATIFNAWDTCCMALNGMDFDGDIVMLTDNPVLLRRHVKMPPLMCAQRKAIKKVPTEADVIASNIASFGDDIGRTTNWVTSMYEVRDRYPERSRQYETLSYRIRIGQLIQQNCIDRAKGIVCKPMPRAWHDHHIINSDICDNDRSFYHDIAADKKPYFMRYIYPSLMRQYNEYISNSNKNAIREFGISMSDVLSIPDEEKTERMKEYVGYYYKCIPVGLSDCVMNRICRRFEKEFDGYLVKNKPSQSFDYSIMKSGVEYTKRQMANLRQIYKSYTSRLRDFYVFTTYERIGEEEEIVALTGLREDFLRQGYSVCSNRFELCDIILDMCYGQNKTKKFAWDICGEEIIDNLLRRNNMTINVPVIDDDGDIEYKGKRFSLQKIELECFDEYNLE